MAAALNKVPRTPVSSLSKIVNKPPPSTSAISDPTAVNRVKSKIRSEPDPDRLADLFQSSSSSPLFHGDRPLYKLSILKLARSKRPDLIERVLEHQRSDTSLPKSEGFLIRIITLYSHAGMVDQAVRTFDSLPDLGLKHSERTFCALLTVFLKNRLFSRLIESFNQLPEKINLSPGITAHNILLQGLSGKGDVEGAHKLLDEMPKKGLKPDIVSYNAVFNGYLKKGDKEGCDVILKEMNASGLEGNVATYNCRVAGLCSKGRSFEAEELLDAMSVKGVRANRHTFNMIIEGFCKEGNVKKAVRVFERMKGGKEEEEEGVASPNFETYIVLFKSLVENREFDKGLEVFKECTGRKWAPPFSAVRGLVEGLKKDSKVDEAKGVVEKMRKIVKGDAMEAWKKVDEAISF